MEITNALIIIAAGFAAGFINTIAGGGSLISLPILIFMGLPPTVANASNRIALFSQNIFGVLGFRSKGISAYPYSLWLGLSALVGAIIGAKLAVDIKDDVFNRILAIIMVLVVLTMIVNPVKAGKQERTSTKYTIIGLIVFFFIGIYGGFIQVGVGFMIMAALTSINGFSLVKTNSAKVFIVLVYMTAALAVFIWEDKINWYYGIVMAIGNSSGAWFASRWSVEKGDKWIKIFMIVTVIAMAVKLWVSS
jgi:uncharacterized membrane protein YfcA